LVTLPGPRSFLRFFSHPDSAFTVATGKADIVLQKQDISKLTHCLPTFGPFSVLFIWSASQQANKQQVGIYFNELQHFRKTLATSTFYIYK
jgi:hypothetical protein